MRKIFITTLVELAEKDPRIVLLTGDLGYSVLESFKEKFPDRFFNTGVAEQNMVGLATGLAEAGFIPFVYSIATFATLRPYEFIRNGPVLHNLPVRIVGTGGGFEYGSAGITHHGLEDLGVMRQQPGLSVIAPMDFQQTRTVLLKTWDLPGPVYYRIGKDDKNTVPGLDGKFEPGRVQQVRDGSDILFMTTGNMGGETVAAADLLEQEGISCAVITAAGLSPAPAEQIKAAVCRFPLVITTESHYRTGGLGSLVAELAAEEAGAGIVLRCGVTDMPAGTSGSQKYYYEKYGLTSVQLADTARDAWRKIQK